MKKCILKASLSAFVFVLIGVGLAFVGNASIFENALSNLLGIFPDYWYLIIAPGVAFLLFVFNIVLKARRGDRSPFPPLALLFGILAFLLVAREGFLELTNAGVVPDSLVYVTGAAIIVLAFLVLLVLSVLDLFVKGRPRLKEEKLLAEEVYEVEGEEVEGEEVKAPAAEETELAPVEYLDEEVEDEDDLEEETEEEAKARKAKKPSSKKADKDVDRIYHVMKRAKDDRWIVKIAQSRKAIKIFDTQKEAIAYAEVLAGNNKGVVRVFASKGANKGRIIV